MCWDYAVSNVGRWDSWYAEVKNPAPYGDVRSYQVAARHLRDGPS